MDAPTLPFRGAPPAFVQRRNNTTPTTSATADTFGTIPFEVDDNKELLGVFDVPNNNTIRALVTCRVLVKYKVNISVGSNIRGFIGRLLLNGATEILGSRAYIAMSSATASCQSVGMFIDLAANDTLAVQIAPQFSAAGTILVGSFFSVSLVRFL